MTRRLAQFQAGFTLIELLIAATIFSVLIGALFTVLFSALRLRESTYAAVESGLPRDQIALLIQRDLANAVAPSGVLAGLLLGEPDEENGLHQDTLNIYTTSGIISENEPWGDVQEIQYYLSPGLDEENDDGYDLMRLANRNLLASTVEEIATEELAAWRLARSVAELQIDYWNMETQEWLETWDSTTAENRNPDAIRMRIVFATDPNSGHRPPPLEVVSPIAPQPRATPTTATSATSGGSNSGSSDSGASGASTGSATAPTRSENSGRSSSSENPGGTESRR